MSGDAPAAAYAGRRVLVTGASGFIGRALTRRLLAAGATAVLLTRPAAAAALRRETAGRAAVLAAPPADGAAVAAAVATAAPAVVFHLAGFTDPTRDLAAGETALEANLLATAALARAALASGVAAFVAAGTAEEYGGGDAPLGEDAPLRPRSPYSASKAAASAWLQMTYHAHGLPAVILRPFLVYGPGQPATRLVPAAIRAALAGRDFAMTAGRQSRDLVFVDDVVDGFLRAGLAPAAAGETINLASGDERAVVDVVEAIYRLIGGPGRPRPGVLATRAGEMHRCVGATAKARRLLGWSATTPFTDGLARTVDWARRHGGRPMPLLAEAACGAAS